MMSSVCREMRKRNEDKELMVKNFLCINKKVYDS